MPPSSTTNDAHIWPRSDFLEAAKGKPFTDLHVFARSPAGRRFLQELAYYEADQHYLTTEKCAQRCRTLSLLLTAALAPGRRT